MNYGNHLFGDNIIELTPGDHYASYSMICTMCGDRHGPPGTWLDLAPCPKCQRIAPRRNKIDGGLKKAPWHLKRDEWLAMPHYSNEVGDDGDKCDKKSPRSL